MRSRVASAIAVIATGALAACASHREPPLPTLEDYSDRVSVFAEKYLEDWKTSAKDPGFYAEGFSWTGPLPGDALEKVASRPPLAITIYRENASSPSRPSPAVKGSELLRARLAEIRGRFASLGRTERSRSRATTS